MSNCVTLAVSHGFTDKRRVDVDIHSANENATDVCTCLGHVTVYRLALVSNDSLHVESM